jgi:GNAT superfamily N-acetyltransferase
MIERLADRHDRQSFDCGEPTLSEWIKRYASQNEARDLSRTYVAVRPENPRICGYYCLSSCHLRLNDVPAKRARKLPKSQLIPAALIGRLAVDRETQGRGLGAILLIDALGRVVRLADQIGTYAIIVDAIDENARRFYLKHGFEAIPDQALRLFVPLTTVRQLQLKPRTE